MSAVYQKVFAVIGGDLRQAYLAQRLACMGYKVYAMYFDREVDLGNEVIRTNNHKQVLPQCTVVVLPLPVTNDAVFIHTPFSLEKVRIEEAFAHINKHATVLGGIVSPAVQRYAENAGIVLIDYFEREELAILNAIPTAEGAVEIAMRELPVTIFGLNCLVTGYGRVSKVLCATLKALGARVTVAARKQSDFAWIRLAGCEPLPIAQLGDAVSEMELIVNTVPAIVLDEAVLSKVKSGCLVIDLASKPGGVDFETAKTIGVKTIWALSLPGKVAPISAGEIIKSTILNILGERSE